MMWSVCAVGVDHGVEPAHAFAQALGAEIRPGIDRERASGVVMNTDERVRLSRGSDESTPGSATDHRHALAGAACREKESGNRSRAAGGNVGWAGCALVIFVDNLPVAAS